MGLKTGKGRGLSAEAAAANKRVLEPLVDLTEVKGLLCISGWRMGML